MNRKWCMYGIAVALSLMVAPAAFSSLIFTGAYSDPTLGLNLSAQAEFDLNAEGNLVVTLTNTSAADVLHPCEVLTGVFFWMDPSLGPLNPLSATLADGSLVWFGPDNAGDLGGEWAYRDDILNFVPQDDAAYAARPTNRGISSSGLGYTDPILGEIDAFGPDDRFDVATNLQGPDSVDGLQYGITSAGDNSLTGNMKVTGGDLGDAVALINNSVVFEFDVAEGFVLDAIGNIWFQYGTDVTEPSYPGFIPGGDDPVPPPPPIPEPATAALLGAGLVACSMVGRYKFF